MLLIIKVRPCIAPVLSFSLQAGNMFSSKRSLLYCSEANTRNISVLARLCPPANSSIGSSAGLPPPQQQQQQQQEEEQQQQQDDDAQQQRDFLLGRCAQAARSLVNDQVVKMHRKQLKAQEQQQQKQQQGVTSYLKMLLQVKFANERETVAAVRAALQTCSTEGVWMLSGLLAALQQHAASVARACVIVLQQLGLRAMSKSSIA
jgi:hypothetical protein